MQRRALLTLLTAGAGATLWAPRGLARGARDPRLAVIVLRGALDGLAAVAPHGDRDYRRVRGALALPAPGGADGVLDLDGYFGLHPALTGLHALHRAGELRVAHAVASPYRARSHFDAQNVLDNGRSRPSGSAGDGWLNRALDQSALGPFTGLAAGPAVPLLMRGPNDVTSWAPSRLPDANDRVAELLMDLYQDDRELGDALARSMDADAMLEDVGAATGMQPGAVRGRRQALAPLIETAARLLRADGGPRVASFEVGGWDTHANQGAAAGQLATRLQELDRGIMMLRQALGPAWSHTVLVVITEFGRTAAPNGTAGTDHGTASVALLAGGALAGGPAVIADWPGLSAGRLYQDRDLAPTRDLRGLLKGVLHDHLEISRQALAARVFPDSAGAAPWRGLIA